MKFNIFNYSQKEALLLKLDLKDLLILDWFQTFQPKMNKTIHEQEQYYWINYASLIADIPIIEITTERGLYKRLINLCKIGILKHLTKRTNGGCYSYYMITEKILLLVSPESSSASVPKVQVQKPRKFKCKSPESSEHIVYNSSTINSSTINSSFKSHQNFKENQYPSQCSLSENDIKFLSVENSIEGIIKLENGSEEEFSAPERTISTPSMPIHTHTNKTNQNQNNTALSIYREKCNIIISEEENEALSLWLEYKQEKKQKYSDKSLPSLLRKLRKLTTESNATALEIIDNAIANNYQGFFHINNQKQFNKNNYDNKQRFNTSSDIFRTEDQRNTARNITEECVSKIIANNIRII